MALLRLRSTKILPLLLAAAGCAGTITDSEDDTAVGALSVPSRVKVNGKIVDVESNYLPRVVQCEDPGAPLEAMKAQAIAARTYLAYRAEGRRIPSIVDGEEDQVYTCPANQFGRFVSADAQQAVKDTAGLVVQADGALTAGFFVAGARRDDRTCSALADATRTERFVTYNFGVTGNDRITRSTIGSKDNVDNHGCLGQNMANCLAGSEGYGYPALLRYFYGSDVYAESLGAAAPRAELIQEQALEDAAAVTCFSTVLNRQVPVLSCVQATDQKYSQCQADGRFTLLNGALDQALVGCTHVFALGI